MHFNQEVKGHYYYWLGSWFGCGYFCTNLMINKKFTAEVPNHNRSKACPWEGIRWLWMVVLWDARGRWLEVHRGNFLQVSVCFWFWWFQFSCQSFPNLSAPVLGRLVTWKWFNLPRCKGNASDVSSFRR